MKRALGMAEGWKSEGSLPSAYPLPLQLTTTDTSTHSEGSHTQMAPSSANAASGRNSVQEAGWASVQRAVSAANAAQSRHAMEQEREQTFTSMPPPPMPLSDQAASNQTASYADWTPRATASAWPLSQADDSLSFDFGFSQPDHPYSSDASQSQDSPETSSVPGFTIPADTWPSTVHAPTAPNRPTAQPDHGPPAFPHTQPIDINQPTSFSTQADTSFQLPQYPASRRGSASDELTSTFGNFVLVGTPPVPSPLRTASDLDSFKRSDGEVDLATRRKRPRPAAIGTATVRSRSFGAPPSMSPTFKLGNHSPLPHSVRQVKSTGQNLNVRYSGIRKPSSAQRSPLNVATFAEADAWRELLESRPIHADHTAGTTPPTPVSSDEIVAHQFPILDDGLYSDLDQHTPHQCYFNRQLVNFNMASPPSTPFKPEFYPAHLQSAMPPLSAPAQYAAFPDHTPPYSAGPLTSSSWSDAQFTSTEMPYPTAPTMYPMAQDLSNGLFQNFAPPPPPKTDTVCAPTADQKQTEFFIQEFPRQKEEHAHAAQQLAQQKPKNYVFANATPTTFENCV
jgi:hypothetical protein